MELEKKVRQPRKRRDPNETPVERVKRVRRDKLKAEVRADLKKNKKGHKSEPGGIMGMKPYRGKCKLGDRIVFRFIGNLYRGEIIGIFEQTEWSESMWKVQSGDTIYPVRDINVIDKEDF